MFVTEKLCMIKQSIGSPKTSICNCGAKSNIYIHSLHNQIHYHTVEYKMKNSIIQSLLCYSTSKNANDYNDKGDNSSPISEKAENDNSTLSCIML